MRVIASSVIRSAIRGQSHGGLYIIDTDTKQYQQVLDWNYPHISWDSGGGDRGLRGIVFYKEFLYTAGGTHIYKFNNSFELIDKFTHRYLCGTHEMCIDNDILYCIANDFDSILFFDLIKEEWIGGFYHTIGKFPKLFKNDDEIPHGDTLHLDSITIKDHFMWYSGSTTEYMYGFNISDFECKHIKLYHKNTHNAQFWKDGIVYNRALESQTCYQAGDKLVKVWPTPKMDRSIIQNVWYGDHARAEYTRGMAIDGDCVAIGTSPASVHFLSLNSTEPLESVALSTDIRNSICGLSLCPWSIK